MSFCATVFWNWPKKLYPVTRFDRSDGRFQTDFVFGVFCWRKNGGILTTLRFFSWFGIIDNIKSWRFYSQIVAQKHHRCIPKACWNRWKSSRWLLLKRCVFHLSKGSSTLTEGFFKKTKLDVIRWRQTREESLKMCRKSGLEFLQRKTLCIDLIVVYAVIRPCML